MYIGSLMFEVSIHCQANMMAPNTKRKRSTILIDNTIDNQVNQFDSTANESSSFITEFCPSHRFHVILITSIMMFQLISLINLSCSAQVMVVKRDNEEVIPLVQLQSTFASDTGQQQLSSVQPPQSSNRRLPRLLSYMSSLIQKSRHSKHQNLLHQQQQQQSHQVSNNDNNNNLTNSSNDHATLHSHALTSSSSPSSKLHSKNTSSNNNNSNGSIVMDDFSNKSSSMLANLDTGKLIKELQYVNMKNSTALTSNIYNNSNENIDGTKKFRAANKLHKSLHIRRHHHHNHRHHHLHHHLTAKNGAHHQSAISALESIVNEVAKAQQLTPLNLSPSDSMGSSNSLNSPWAHLPSTEKNAFNSRGFFLTSMLSRIMNVLNVTEFALEMRDGISSRASCMACNAVAGLFLSPLYSKEVFSAAIITVCTSFRVFTQRVCHGVVESFQDDFEYIRKNTRLTRDEICAVIFGMECARRQTYKLTWTVPIPGPRNLTFNNQDGNLIKGNSNDKESTSSILDNQQHSTNIGTPKPNSMIQDHTFQDDAPDLFEYRKSPASLANFAPSPTPASMNDTSLREGKILSNNNELSDNVQYVLSNGHLRQDRDKVTTFVQITDIHIDPYYEPGTNTDSQEPLCCRIGSGMATESRKSAGVWGDYGNCDTPVTTLRHSLDRIRKHHFDSEYWIWTGDIAPHDIWNISKAEVVNQIRLLNSMVKEYANVPVFPVVGNHEAVPVNSFPPPEIKGKFSMSWLYNVLAEEWSHWLPEEALTTLKIGGYYRVQLRKGFRLIGLNTNYCARLNPWSLYESVDPGNQLKWLTQELLLAEDASDKVHIIGHVPPDNRECTQAWLFNFIRIVDRFKDTILGQFYGHTHRDEFRVIYSLRNEQPVGVAYIGPSITPFTENNPAYRVYHQNQIGHLVDTETYFFNLTEANQSSDGPNWRHEYRLSHTLNMTSMRPKDWHQYIQRLQDDDQLFDQFHRHFYRNSDVKKNTICRSKCKYQMLGDLRVSHPYKTRPKSFLNNRKTSNHHHHG